MTDRTAANSGDRIVLAHEQDFELGAGKVRPALREICGDGWTETLEPRVMQVLVALARARGAVVSRDDLVLSCWEGRAVSEDVIYRCIRRLRRLLETEHCLCTVRTIPRVGYRLGPTVAPRPEVQPGRPKSENEALSELIGHIYDCAIDPTQWDDALAHLVSLLSPADWDVAILMWESIAPPRARFVGATGLSSVAREIYSETFAGRSSWSVALAALGPGRVLDTDEIMSRSEFRESPLYKSFLSTWGMELAVAAIIDRQTPDLLGLVMPGPPGRDLEGLKFGLRLLAPHLQRAIRISRCLGEANLRAEAAETALDRAPVAVATLMADLSVVNINAKALALVDSGEVRLRGNVLSFEDPAAQCQLVDLSRAEAPASANFKIVDANGNDVVVLAARIKTQVAPALGGDIEGASIILSIGVGGRAPLLEINRLGDRFGLTATEARLATALAAGDSLRCYAERRHMSMNALRLLLKHIYRKTDTASLEDMVSRVRRDFLQ
jgi:DNA-binding winged helix-turn-helix (wHTH) protein/DNA-binding CsgD family transcriptional regulator